MSNKSKPRLNNLEKNFQSSLTTKDKNKTIISVKTFLNKLLNIKEQDRYTYIWQDFNEVKVMITAVFNQITFETILISLLDTIDTPYKGVYSNSDIFNYNPTVWYAESQKLTRIFNILSRYNNSKLVNVRNFLKNELNKSETLLIPRETVKDEKGKDLDVFDLQSIGYESILFKKLFGGKNKDGNRDGKDKSGGALSNKFKLSEADIDIESGRQTKIEGAEADYNLLTKQIAIKNHVYKLLLLPALNEKSSVNFKGDGKEGGKNINDFSNILPVELGKAIYDLWYSATRVGNRENNEIYDQTSWWDDLYVILYRMTFMEEIKTLEAKYRIDVEKVLKNYTGAGLFGSQSGGIELVRRKIVDEMVKSNSPVFQKIAAELAENIAEGKYEVDEETLRRLVFSMFNGATSGVSKQSLSDLGQMTKTTSKKMSEASKKKGFKGDNDKKSFKGNKFQGNKFQGNKFQGNKFQGNKFQGNKFQGNKFKKKSKIF
jgi:hypothetical protein